MSENVKEMKPKVRAITPARVKYAEHERQSYAVNPEMGVTVEDMKEPGYWAHVGHQLKPFDRIEARAEDGSWFAELLVRSAGRGWAQVAVLAHYELGGETMQGLPSRASEYKVEWGGPHHKHRVVRVSDGNVMKHGFESADAARAWLADHLKALAA